MKKLTDKLTLGQVIADKVTAIMGSWTFIIAQSIFLTFWIALNITAYMHKWDPYPFILLNLVLSFQAAYSAPIIMMAQNRQAAKDRAMAEEDYKVNKRAEKEIKDIMKHLAAQDETMIHLLKRLEAQHILIMERLNKPGGS